MSQPPTLVAQPDWDRVPYTMQLSMLSTADIEVTQGKILDMQSSIKALTGNDMSDGGIRVNVTAVVSTMNKLYYPIDITSKSGHY
jgi:hypothetical protein